MSAREMWATKYWLSEGSQWLRDQGSGTYDVRVLVQEIPEGMPGLKPGDRVRINKNGVEDIVDAHPFIDKNGNWRVPLFHTMSTHRPDFLTKLPPETSRLIRVTGPERGVNETVQILRNRQDAAILTRVEVVDE